MKTNPNSKKNSLTKVVALAAIFALPGVVLADNAQAANQAAHRTVVQQDRADLTPAHPVRFNTLDGQPIR